MSSSLVVEPAPSNMGTSMGKSCPTLPARSGVSRLMVTPRVSGLERSQEKNLEPHFPEPVSSSTSSASFSCLPSHSPVTASGTVPRHSPMNGNGGRHNGSPPLSKPKPFLTLPGRSHSIYNINNRCANRRASSLKVLLYTMNFTGLIYFSLNGFVPCEYKHSLFLSSQEQHPSQTSICFICCVFLILHATPDSLHQCVSALQPGCRILRAPPTPIPSQLWAPVHVLTWPASTSPSATRSFPLNSSRYSQQECYFSLLSQSVDVFQLLA